MARKPQLNARIVDAALARADRVGWAQVRLHDLADDLGIRLTDVYGAFPDLDAVGTAIFARADRAMLEATRRRGFTKLAARDRLSMVIMAWFEVLAPHREHVAAILGYKFALAHVHLRVALIVRLSRTVQWIREAARLDATGLRHDVEEVGLTVLFVGTVGHWLSGRTDLAGTRSFLERRLDRADTVMARLWPPTRSPSEHRSSPTRIS